MRGGDTKSFCLSPNARKNENAYRWCRLLRAKWRKKNDKGKTHAIVKCRRYWKQKVEADQKRGKKVPRGWVQWQHSDIVMALAKWTEWTKWTLNRSQLHYLLLLLIFAHKSRSERSRTEYLCLIKITLELLRRLLGALNLLCNFDEPKACVE